MGLESYELDEAFLVSGPSTFFRARNAVLRNEVMVRRLTVDASRAEDARETFFREQRLGAALHHPHIQRPIDVFEADGYLWSVHEMLTLHRTQDIIASDGPMTLAEVCHLGAQLADAVSHMHDHGYVHGKVSPITVLRSARGDATIVSLVKAADLAQGLWPLRPAVLGLSPFTPPEEFHGTRPGEGADLYGVAATIVYWLTARHPRGGRDEEEALARARDGAPLLDLKDLREDLPDVLVKTLEAALAARPEDRHGSVSSLGSLLVEIHQRLAAEIPSGFHPGAVLEPLGEIERVRVVRRHGAGAFGVVLQARDEASDRALAVKALKPEHRDDRNAYERFRRETRSLRLIDHPNVVRVHAVGELDGTPYAVMEFIDGPDLATILLRDGCLGPVRAARLGASIARGLHAIHQETIVHRDLKPHNILVADDDRAVIADFGIARADGGRRLTMTGHLVGTPAYMAPEQFTDDTPGPAADLYALGAMLHEMLTSRVPFEADDTLDAIRRIREVAVAPLPPEVPDGLATIVLQLLAKDPLARPASASHVSQMLDDWLAAAPPTDRDARVCGP